MNERIKLDDLRERYFFVDPAGEKQAVKRVASESAYVGLAVDDIGRIFVLEDYAARCSTEQLVDKLYAVNERWAPTRIGIEEVGTQQLFVAMVRRDARITKRPLPIVGIQQSTRQDKDYRIRTILQPILADGRLFILAGAVALRQDIAVFPSSYKKDRIDALASCIRMVPPRRVTRDRDLELEAHLRYLRESGASAEQILEEARRSQRVGGG